MNTYLYLTIPFFIFGLFFLGYAIWSSNPKNRISVIGRLTRSHTVKNVTLGSHQYPYLTTYTYTYTVGNRQYQRKGEARFHHRRNLPRNVEFIYVKGFPRFAYKHRYTGIVERSMALLGIVSGIVLTLLIYFGT